MGEKGPPNGSRNRTANRTYDEEMAEFEKALDEVFGPEPDPPPRSGQVTLMHNNQLFCQISSKRIAELIQKANGSVCYAGPGIQKEPAKAMSEVAERIGSDKVTVSLDFNEHVLRMGYGDRGAIEILRKAHIEVNRAPGFRSGLIIVDGEGYVFTPTPLYLEAESDSDSARNAMRLLPGQVAQALARLSPKTREVAVAQAKDPEMQERLASLRDEVCSLSITDDQLKQVDQRLKEAPPVDFDVARQVRVYVAYLQYVEVTLIGAAFHRRRVKIPRVLQELGVSPELEGRLETTFDLLGEGSDLRKAFKSLEKDLEKLKDTLAPPCKGYGRVILKKEKELFSEELDKKRATLNCLREKVAADLQDDIAESRKAIIDYYLPRVMDSDDPPLELRRAQSHTGKPKKKDAREWLNQVLERELPTPDTLTQEMKINVRYKNVTLEDLECEDFLDQVKKAFPNEDWDRAHEEFLAAGEGNSADERSPSS